MIELATIIAGLAATDTGLKTVKTGAGTIKAIQDLLRGKSDGSEVDVTALKELIQDLRDDNLTHREALQEAREKLLEIKRTAESSDAAEEKRNLYRVRDFEAGGTVMQLRNPDETGSYPSTVCYVCFEKEEVYLPMEKFETYFVCRNCNRTFEFAREDPAPTDYDFDPRSGINNTTGY
ncbi:hypothetical protein [Roseobacter sp. OBYS 0001]|uniref:hypothetical protein n=1 Tax=Roseobacter sp. OBYS 0001 TaxID=882651 RepID=UPI001BBE5A90|nr:hypothetical protein [Roseobacter sp. OBYS 0001]GIT85419.1 hypothetical protein ROBYS_04350 [Roseobacter sp. OBYS 0001]